jgi:hypothetical protein
MLAAGSLPDGFGTDQNDLLAAVRRDDAQAPDALLRRDAVDLTDFVPAGLGPAKLDDHQHGLPRAFNPASCASPQPVRGRGRHEPARRVERGHAQRDGPPPATGTTWTTTTAGRPSRRTAWPARWW